MPTKPHLNSVRNLVSAIGVAGGLALAGSAVALTHAADVKTAKSALTVPVDESAVPRDGLPRGSFAPIVQKVVPAVVKIETTAKARNAALELPPGFGEQFGRALPHGPIQHGLGSGVIVTKDGYILTNNHVVDGATEVKVTLEGGREYTAKVIGRDPKTDLAVVKIDAKDLPVVPMADSDKVLAGDVTLAVGHPFGVGKTVTSGIVSATDRGNMGIEDYENFIQTDAAINPGNSGGALVDIEGRLIGINTAILSHSGGSQGVGFAVPSNTAREVMESIIENGHVTRGYLGMMIQNVTPALAQEFKLKDNAGALIGDVVPDGPAASAGLKSGDVVLKINGRKVTDSRQLRLNVAEIKPGSQVPVEIVRDGEAKTLSVTVKQLPGSNELAKNDRQETDKSDTLNGVAVGDLDQRTRTELHIPGNVHGAIVTQVDPNSAAAQAGLKPGAVIQSINREPVKTAADAVRLTENASGKNTLLRLWENGGSHFVVVDENQKAG